MEHWKDGKNRAPKKGKTDGEQNIEIELWEGKDQWK